MDKSVRKTALEDAKMDEYRCWQRVSDSERIAAAWEHIKAAYRSKGLYEDGQKLQRSLVSIRPLRG